MHKSLTIFILCLIFIACNNSPDNSNSFVKTELPDNVQSTNKYNITARLKFDSLLRVSLQQKWLGQIDLKLNNLNECLSIAQQLNNDSLYANVYLAMSGFYDDMGEYNFEVEILDKALEKFEATHNYHGCVSVYNNMAWAYVQAFDYKKGIEHARNGLSLAQKELKDSVQYRVSSLLYATLALAFLENHQADSALKYNILAYQKLPYVRRGNLNQYCWLFSTFGNIYAQKKDLRNSEISFKKVLVFKDSSTVADAAIFAIGKYCQLLNQEKRYTETIAIGKEGLNIAQKTGLVRYQIDIADELRISFEKLKQTDSAYAYSKIATALRDSVFNIRKSIQLQSMSFKRDMKAKELKFEIEKVKAEEKLIGAQRLKNIFMIGLVFVMLIAVIFFRQRNKIRDGKIRSDELLRNILPEEVAEELKSKGSTSAKYFDQVSILFTDFKNFTQIAERLTPQELVSEIDTCFKAFDQIIEKHQIEKIKTIGDAYMCVGGLPVPNDTHALDIVKAAIDIQQFIAAHTAASKAAGKEVFEIRIGIHSGPVVAGVVGYKKFAYDIWGDTVNIASRMESSGEAGKINISETTYSMVKEQFNCSYRGKIEVKNKGNLTMYFVEGSI